MVVAYVLPPTFGESLLRIPREEGRLSQATRRPALWSKLHGHFPQWYLFLARFLFFILAVIGLRSSGHIAA